MKQGLNKPLIPGRVFLVGEGKIPREIIESIEDKHFKIFLREPNPELWPKEIKFLVEYLPEDERRKWELHKIFSKYEDVIAEPLKEWIKNIKNDLKGSALMENGAGGVLLEEILDYLKETVTRHGFLPLDK